MRTLRSSLSFSSMRRSYSEAKFLAWLFMDSTLASAAFKAEKQNRNHMLLMTRSSSQGNLLTFVFGFQLLEQLGVALIVATAASTTVQESLGSPRGRLGLLHGGLTLDLERSVLGNQSRQLLDHAIIKSLYFRSQFKCEIMTTYRQRKRANPEM